MSFMWIYKGLLILWIGGMLEGIGVPMVFQSRTNILEWNVKVLHYVDYVFIFADKFLSQSGAIFLLHSNDLQILK
jgi:hypothetical protein